MYVVGVWLSGFFELCICMYMRGFMIYICIGYVPEGYPTKDAYPPPGYSQGYPQPGYPPAGYPLPQPQPQVVYTQAPAPPQKEVGCLEGWLVSLSSSLSLDSLINFL